MLQIGTEWQKIIKFINLWCGKKKKKQQLIHLATETITTTSFHTGAFPNNNHHTQAAEVLYD